MTLQQAIEKAITNGWKPPAMDGVAVDTSGHIVFFKDGGRYYQFSPYQVIYSHDFARALWGEEEDYYFGGSYPFGVSYPAWQSHLMQMVIEPYPINYLEDNA